ncbi:MAG: hypothetical protein IJS74_01725 [Clostridia bacterium]|nr:hypothetical protein [Clostridia bacterium]
MEKLDLNSFIGESVEDVKKTLSDRGMNIIVEEFLKPKMKTDSKLVVALRQIDANTIKLVVGDFLINL